MDRAALDAWLSALTGHPVDTAAPVDSPPYTDWDIFPRVAAADFDPLLAGDAGGCIWWSCWADAAFDSNNVLTRPMLLRWRGSRNALQLSAARAGLTLRLVPTAPYDQAGLAVLAPASLKVQTDLSRLLAAFAALRAGGVVALERAGMTRSDGWSDVAGVQRHPRQTAVFWHDQNHDGFDGLSMLTDTLCLYWRGDRARIAAPLQAAGLTVEVPTNDDVAFVIRSSHPPPTLPTVADAERFERPLPSSPTTAVTVEGPLQLLARSSQTAGYPIEGLWPSPDGSRLLVSYGYSRRGSPDTPLSCLDPRALAPLPGPPLPAHLCMGAVCWLSADRALIAWIDYHADAHQKLVLSDWRGEEATEVLRLVDTHPAQRCVLSVDAARSLVALPQPSGVTVRNLGAPGTAARQLRPGVRVRRKRDRGPQPWGERAQFRDQTPGAYTMAALSPDGRTVAWTRDGAYSLHAYDRESGALLWTGAPMERHSGSRSTRQLGFTPDGQHVFVRTRRGLRAPSGETVTTTRTLLFDARTSTRDLTALERALDGATAVAFGAAPWAVAAGMPDGRLRLLDRDGRQLALARPFAHGGVSAVAIIEGQVYAGSSRGELCVLRWPATGGPPAQP